jgi:hypothetical protein
MPAASPAAVDLDDPPSNWPKLMREAIAAVARLRSCAATGEFNCYEPEAGKRIADLEREIAELRARVGGGP